jgi:hypothetical protein
MFDSKAFCLNTPSVHFLIKYCIWLVHKERGILRLIYFSYP